MLCGLYLSLQTEVDLPPTTFTACIDQVAPSRSTVMPRGKWSHANVPLRYVLQWSIRINFDTQKVRSVYTPSDLLFSCEKLCIPERNISTGMMCVFICETGKCITNQRKSPQTDTVLESESGIIAAAWGRNSPAPLCSPFAKCAKIVA